MPRPRRGERRVSVRTGRRRTRRFPNGPEIEQVGVDGEDEAIGDLESDRSPLRVESHLRRSVGADPAAASAPPTGSVSPGRTTCRDRASRTAVAAADPIPRSPSSSARSRRLASNARFGGAPRVQEGSRLRGFVATPMGRSQHSVCWRRAATPPHSHEHPCTPRYAFTASGRQFGSPPDRPTHSPPRIT